MPYILNSQEDQQKMLEAIGASSLEELYSQIPTSIRLTKALNLEDACSEFQVKKIIKGLSLKNKSLENFNSFLGAGCYDHYVPAAVQAIISSPQFVTAYTPYQAECSQGILQAIYEYQSFICLLTGMDVSNASLLDGASSVAEAALMALRITKRKKIFVSCGLNPEYKETLKTYLSGFDFVIEEIGGAEDGTLDIKSLKRALDRDTSCFILQSPNFLGLIEDLGQAQGAVKEVEALLVAVVNPLSLAILKAPAEAGADIVCGDGQVLGGGLNLGSSCFGFLATKSQYLRQMPGRVVGKTTDKDGHQAYCLTLQAREQHIRREKATSNICSNHSLNAISAAVYLSLLGKDGLRNIASYSFSNTQYLYQRMKEVRGINVPYPPKVFNEFIWEPQDQALDLMDKLYQKNIIAGYWLGQRYPEYKNSILSCCTEKKTKQDIDNFVNTLGHILHG